MEVLFLFLPQYSFLPFCRVITLSTVFEIRCPWEFRMLRKGGQSSIASNMGGILDSCYSSEKLVTIQLDFEGCLETVFALLHCRTFFLIIGLIIFFWTRPLLFLQTTHVFIYAISYVDNLHLGDSRFNHCADKKFQVLYFPSQPSEINCYTIWKSPVACFADSKSKSARETLIKIQCA